MLKEGISTDESWLHGLSPSHPREAPAHRAGSVLQVAHEAHRASHPCCQPDTSHGQPWVIHPAQRMIPNPLSFELQPHSELVSVLHSGRQQDTATLHWEHVSGPTVHLLPFPQRCHRPPKHVCCCLEKHSPWVTFLLPQLPSGWWSCQGCSMALNLCCVPCIAPSQPWGVPLTAGSAAALPGFWRLVMICH